jgi:hypothetical protein
MLADGRTATLRGNYAAGSEGYFQAARGFVVNRIGTNQVFIGPRSFGETDLVNAISFRPTNEFLSQYYIAHRAHAHWNGATPLEPDKLFTHPPVLEWGELIIDAIDGNRLIMCEFDHDNMKVTLGTSISGRSDAQGVETTEQRFTRIDYTDPVPLTTMLVDLMTIANFYSFVVGEVVTPTEVSIESGHEEAPVGRPRFEFRTRFRRPGANLHPREARRCLISHPEDGDNYTRSLRLWVERREEWGQSYFFGSESLAQQKQITRHRYLDAAGWFESIPTFYLQSEPSISRQILGALTAAAKTLLNAKGVDVSENRLRDVLAMLRTPPLGARLRAAMAHIRARFGDAALPPRAEDLIPRMSGLRGRLAHGENPLSSHEAGEMHELTFLFETVCWFLTLSALPWNPDRLDRAHGHPMQFYRMNLFGLAKIRAAAASPQST